MAQLKESKLLSKQLERTEEKLNTSLSQLTLKQESVDDLKSNCSFS
jgi:hypothetical protein